ncbi:MAG TPA: CoA activase [Spirochaeta sp.]|nr:CoA activase [Spirochaeta sp.]
MVKYLKMKDRIIGIDSGSVTVSLVVMTFEGKIAEQRYEYHHGKPAKVLREMLLGLDLEAVAGVAKTASTPDVIDGALSFDPVVSIIQGVKYFYADFRSILNVGGEKFALIEFDRDGNYVNMKSNSSCAAGTGGFLDQQAKRLNLESSADLSYKALSNEGEVPKIASRCSVFAKTDIIHSQQEGYSLEGICDGLSLGLANNIADTLIDDKTDYSPMIFTGGVAVNKAVAGHLENILGHEIEVHEFSHLIGAVGAVQLFMQEPVSDIDYSSESIHEGENSKRDYFYPPLELKLSDYPDFNGLQHYEYSLPGLSAVEVDIYQNLSAGDSFDVSMGIDIGSTSTKAIIIDSSKSPIAGFYTRTAGRPIKAVQAIFEVCSSWLERENISFDFTSVGSTGSGRKFIGTLLGADTVLDEISAHARAAVELDPDIDTIIEIGGQDSKFTTLRKGVVTFSQMNTVCAAGTGSFIEEQALKLGVTLSEYASLAEGARAPLASDRCTVFMERDINHYLNKNYEVNEILAAVLFSVRENYLHKVASEGNIGDRIFFQGATAKNKALVAAFEQKLNKPVFVSKYCHLTGALGAAITAAEEQEGNSEFRGLDICRENIAVRTELCDLCLNHCRIRVAEVKGEEVAYGFLCGRDYNTRKYVNDNKVPSLLKIRQSVLAPLKLKQIENTELPVVGIPSGLRVFEETPLWQKFFHSLGIRTVTSESVPDVISRGKKLAGAEFCSPMTAFYGHADALAAEADVIFLPIHISDKKDEKDGSRLRKFCYYTQFSSTLVSKIRHKGKEIKSMMPLINHRSNPLKTKYELMKVLNQCCSRQFSFLEISQAFDEAVEYYREVKQALSNCFKPQGNGDIRILLLGRPYTVLLDSMNKNIPDFFASLGVETFFSDMIPAVKPSDAVDGLLDQFHWAYPSEIIEAADYCTRSEGLYPVYVTSFKCAPDSFTLEFFKRIMEQHEKPYLILQIDDHDSSIGYETRIEAGIRAFRNHFNSSAEAGRKKKLPVLPEMEDSFEGKTVLLPNWDPFVLPLVAAILRNIGIDARVLEESPEMIAESMKMNTGQCIPVNAIAHEYVEYIRKFNLKPEDTVLWMIRSRWACNITMYPTYIKSLIEKEDEDMAGAGIYTGKLTMVDISPIVSIKAYFAYMFGGNLRKIGCMIRPYEVVKGETDRVIIECRDIFEKAFSGEMTYTEAVKLVIGRLDSIEYIKTDRPKVAIFGDLYVRDNDVMNQNLIQYIEDAGGEVIITPYNEYAKIISGAVFKRWLKDLKVPEMILTKSLLAAMEVLEGRYYRYLGKYIGRPISSKNPDLESELARFNIRVEQEGESSENILKIFRIMKEHPDIALFIQTNPAFCCPSLVTEAMDKEIEKLTGVPVLSITYDGTETMKNDIIIPYLKYAKSGRKLSTSAPYEPAHRDSYH